MKAAVQAAASSFLKTENRELIPVFHAMLRSIS